MHHFLSCWLVCFPQVMSLSPAPLSLLIKAAPILTDDMYGDVQPAAWELLLSVDEHMAAAAGESGCASAICVCVPRKGTYSTMTSTFCPLPPPLSRSPPAAMFLLCAVKVPDAVTEMMMAELHHQEACQRINSVLKFYTLWRFRYQVWPRMEEGAQQIFKVWNNTSKFCFHFVPSEVSYLDPCCSLFVFSFRSLHPASTSLCPLPYWACPVSPYLTPPGCPRTQAASRIQSTKTSL